MYTAISFFFFYSVEENSDEDNPPLVGMKRSFSNGKNYFHAHIWQLLSKLFPFLLISYGVLNLLMRSLCTVLKFRQFSLGREEICIFRSLINEKIWKLLAGRGDKLQCSRWECPPHCKIWIHHWLFIFYFCSFNTYNFI